MITVERLVERFEDLIATLEGIEVELHEIAAALKAEAREKAEAAE